MNGIQGNMFKSVICTPSHFVVWLAQKKNAKIPLENSILQTCTKLMYTLNDEESLFKQKKA